MDVIEKKNIYVRHSLEVCSLNHDQVNIKKEQWNAVKYPLFISQILSTVRYVFETQFMELKNYKMQHWKKNVKSKTTME